MLPVDAHPDLEHWSDGTLMRARLQSYDSTFGLQPTESYTLHGNGVHPRVEAGGAAVRRQPVLLDRLREHGCTGAHDGHHQPGWFSVDVPDTGTTIRVVDDSAGGQGFMQVRVNVD